MIKMCFSLIAVLAFVACSPTPESVPDDPDASQVEYQEGKTMEELVRAQDMPIEKRWMREPELGRCGAPDKIEGAMLVRQENGLVELGWWSHCEEGAFVSIPIEQEPFPGNEVFPAGALDKAPAHLTCHRMSDELAEDDGVYARYACATDAGFFDTLRYYYVPHVPPKPEPKKVPGQSI